MAPKMNAKKAQLQKGKGALTPQPQKGTKYVNKGPRSEPPTKKKMMLEAADDSEEEITFEGPGATKLFAAASDSDSEDMDSAAVQIAKVGQKRKITQGTTSPLLGKKSETPVKKNQQSKSPQQIKQLNGQERTPAQKGKAQTPAKSNNLKGTPGQQKGQKQMPGKKQTPKSKPAVQAEEDLSDEEEEEEEIQLPIKGSNQKQNSAIKVQTPVQTVQKTPKSTPGQQKSQKQTLGDKQTAKGRPAVKGEEDLSKEEEMLDEDEDEEEEEDSDEEEETPPKAGQKRKLNAATPLKETKAKTSSGDSQISREEEESRTLFVGNITDQVTEEDLKKLSPDIIEVRLRFRGHKRKGHVTLIHFAYLVFKSEQLAEKNYKKLKDAKFKSSVLRVDYVGHKRQHGKEVNKDSETKFNRTRLYVSGLNPSTSELDLRKIFPTASEITIPKYSGTEQHYGYGFIQFASETLAKTAKEKVQGKITVNFAFARSESTKKELTQKKLESATEESDDSEEEEEEKMKVLGL